MPDSKPHSGPFLAADGETWVLKSDYDGLKEQLEAALNLIHDIHEANPNGYYGQEHVEAFLAPKQQVPERLLGVDLTSNPAKRLSAPTAHDDGTADA